MDRSSVSKIKRERKKALFLRKVSELIQSLASEDPLVASVFITHVELSADTGVCYIYFSAYPDATDRNTKTIFEEALEKLKLYKPSMRSALAKMLHGRYVPNLVFLFDEKREKVERINDLLDQAQEEAASEEEPEHK